jgi:hypothetical protein
MNGYSRAIRPGEARTGRPRVRDDSSPWPGVANTPFTSTLPSLLLKSELMPVLHMFFHLLRDTTLTIELFVEGRIQVMDNNAEVTLE